MMYICEKSSQYWRALQVAKLHFSR